MLGAMTLFSFSHLVSEQLQDKADIQHYLRDLKNLDPF